jgi:hypothetical protein
LLQWQENQSCRKTSHIVNSVSKSFHCLFVNTTVCSAAEAVVTTVAMKNFLKLNKMNLNHSLEMINLFKNLHHFSNRKLKKTNKKFANIAMLRLQIPKWNSFTS